MKALKNLFRFAVCGLSCFILSRNAGAQDVHFSQFYECSSLRNPALTGIFSGDYRAAFSYRNQWSSFAVPYQTAVVSAETKALLREETHDYLSFGLTTVYDKAGSIDFTGMSYFGAVNYNKSLAGSLPAYLSVGLGAGYIQRSFDVTKMRFANQFNGTGYNAASASGEPMNFAPLKHWDASAGEPSGALSRKANYYVGVAAYHVGKPSESYYDEQLIRLSTRWTGSMGMNARLGQGLGMTIHINYQHQQPYEEWIGGFLLSKSFKTSDEKRVVLHGGCFYRYGDAVIPTMCAEFDSWSLNLSYDVSHGGKRMYMNGFGGYEISVVFRGKYPARQELRMQCPQFELIETVDEW